jgi:hypothetical protein
VLNSKAIQKGNFELFARYESVRSRFSLHVALKRMCCWRVFTGRWCKENLGPASALVNASTARHGHRTKSDLANTYKHPSSPARYSILNAANKTKTVFANDRPRKT